MDSIDQEQNFELVIRLVVVGTINFRDEMGNTLKVITIKIMLYPNGQKNVFRISRSFIISSKAAN